MVAITANSGPGFVQTDNPAISSQLSEYAAEYWPPRIAEIVTQQGPIDLERNDPIRRLSEDIVSTSGRGNSHSDDYYNRIHVSPNPINVGNLLAKDTRLVNVWNAFFDEKKILSSIIETNTSGITFIGPYPEPTEFQELEDRDYVLTITLDGSPIIDATFGLVFPSTTIDLKVTGKRIVVFPYRPNWKSTLNERYEWLTDVMIAYDSTEQRRSLRGSPRKSVTYNLVSTDQGRQIYDNLMFDAQARNWAIPMWVDGSPLTSAITALDPVINLNTVDRGYIVGGFALIFIDAVVFEVVEVLSFTSSSITVKDPVLASWNSGTMVYPLRVARLTENHKVSNRSPSVHESKVTFTINTHENFFSSVESASTYRTFPVYNEKSNWAQEVTTDYQRKLDVFDSLTGLITLDDESERSDTARPFNRFLSSRGERAAFVKWLYARQGRFNGIWVPSGLDDFTILDTITAASVNINVRYTNYSISVNGRLNRRDIKILMNDGSFHYTRILSASDNGDNTETLLIDAAIGTQLEPEDISIVSFMDYCRLDADRAEIKYYTPEISESTFIFKSLNDDI